MRWMIFVSLVKARQHNLSFDTKIDVSLRLKGERECKGRCTDREKGVKWHGMEREND